MVYISKRQEILNQIVEARREAEEARRLANEAHERLKRVVVEDLNCFGSYTGYPLADVARAAGISRNTLYRWLKEDCRHPG